MIKPLLVYSAPLMTESGYGHKSRAIAKALIATKSDEYEIMFLPQRWGNTSWIDVDDEQITSRINQSGQLPKQPDVWIMDTISSEFIPVGKYNIGICSGIETTICDPSWIEGNNKMNLVLTSSEHSKNVFKNSRFEQRDQRNGQTVGIIENKVPIEVLSESLDLKVFFKFLPTKDTKLVEKIDLLVNEPFIFLMVGHWIHNGHSLEILGEDRKNVGLLIKIFLETFKNKPNPPALLLKTSGSNSSTIDKEEILKRIDDIRKTVKGTLPNIYLLHGELEDQQMNELYNHPKVKAMVSITKGEGFGRPLLEFSITQKPIITTNWSGHLDFLKPEFTTLLPGTMKNVHPAAVVKNIILPESEWFNVDTVSVGMALTDMYKNYKNYEVNGKRQAHFSKTNFSQEKMEEKLKVILDTYLPKIPKFVPLTISKINLPTLNKE